MAKAGQPKQIKGAKVGALAAKRQRQEAKREATRTRTLRDDVNAPVAPMWVCYGTKIAKRWADGRIINAEATMQAGEACYRVDSATLLERYRDRGQLNMSDAKRNEQLYEAGRRLHEDWTLAGREIRVVAQYGERLPGGDGGGTTAERARARYVDAMRAVGPQLGAILVHVCLLDRPVTEWCKLRGYAVQAGMPLLHMALESLASHYRLRQ